MRADVARLRSERESPVDDNFEFARCGAVRCGAARRGAAVAARYRRRSRRR